MLHTALHDTPRRRVRVHVQVKARCDVALDTLRYNSHGTAADILWAGAPPPARPAPPLTPPPRRSPPGAPSRVPTRGRRNANVTAHVTAGRPAGVPLVSLPGEPMAARLAAALLVAVGFPQLVRAPCPTPDPLLSDRGADCAPGPRRQVARTPADYVSLAAALVARPAARRHLAGALRAARASWSLHDLPGWARRFAAATRLLVDAALALPQDSGGAPAHIVPWGPAR